ncbi:MAG: rod shape-determining protein MreD [Parvibaculaceae bacterium]|nr:rod shape-determining protein MreD [Parvibaculaceae bacterium]
MARAPRLQSAAPTGRGLPVFAMLLPAGSMMLALLASLVPLGSLAGQGAMPGFLLITVFFWAVERPGWLPLLPVFLAGLLIDLVSGGPVGLWALSLLLFYVAVRRERATLIKMGPSARWTAFIAGVLLTGLFAWALASLYYFTMLPPGTITWQVVVTVVLYPVWMLVLAPMRRFVTD